MEALEGREKEVVKTVFSPVVVSLLHAAPKRRTIFFLSGIAKKKAQNGRGKSHLFGTRGLIGLCGIVKERRSKRFFS